MRSGCLAGASSRQSRVRTIIRCASRLSQAVKLSHRSLILQPAIREKRTGSRSRSKRESKSRLATRLSEPIPHKTHLRPFHLSCKSLWIRCVFRYPFTLDRCCFGLPLPSFLLCVFLCFCAFVLLYYCRSFPCPFFLSDLNHAAFFSPSVSFDSLSSATSVMVLPFIGCNHQRADRRRRGKTQGSAFYASPLGTGIHG
jgi:hypothetical protein